jgi:hypothetical protein
MYHQFQEPETHKIVVPGTGAQNAQRVLLAV